MAASRPGPKLDARIEALIEVGVDQTIVPTFPVDTLESIGSDLINRFG